MNKYYRINEVSRARRFFYYAACVLVGGPFSLVYVIVMLLRGLLDRLSEAIEDFIGFLLDKTARRILEKPTNKQQGRQTVKSPSS